MNCVFDAYCDHVTWIDYTRNPHHDRPIFDVMKLLTHGPEPQFTWGGVIPWMIKTLAYSRGYQLQVQHRLVTKAHYLADLEKQGLDATSHQIARNMVLAGDFGEEVDEITLEPAIYLMWPMQHAQFAIRIPSQAIVVMAIQLKES